MTTSRSRIGSFGFSVLVLAGLAGLACGSSTPGGEATEVGTTQPASSEETGHETLGWTQVYAAGTEVGMLMSVWGATPDEVFVVGGQEHGGGMSVGAMVVYDGASWEVVTLPAGTPWLNWVFGVDGEVWTVGREGTVLRRRDDVWSIVETPTDSELWGVWGESASSLWVVGGEPIQGPPVLLRWDGESFTEVETPFLPEQARALFKVWGRSDDEVYAVGDAGAVAVWDGLEWRSRPNESIAPLFAAWAAADEPVVVVGGRANARIAHVGDAAVEGQTSMLPGLSGVWVDASGRATVVGDRGTIARVPPGTLEPLPEETPTHHLLHATFGFDAGPRFAVGGSFHGPPPKVGVILRADD